MSAKKDNGVKSYCCEELEKLKNKFIYFCGAISVLVFLVSVILIPLLQTWNEKINNIDVMANEMKHINTSIKEITVDIKRPKALSIEERDSIINSIRRSVYGARDDLKKEINK